MTISSSGTESERRVSVVVIGSESSVITGLVTLAGLARTDEVEDVGAPVRESESYF